MKKLLCVILSLILLLPAAVGLNARQFAMLSQNGYAKVLEIIDGDSLRVQFLSTGETALVRLIGVNAHGYDNAIPYLNNILKGRTAAFYFDDFIPMHDGRFNNMYAYLEDELINREIIYLGYAKANERHKNAALYDYLIYVHDDAKAAEVGIWKPFEDLFVPFGRFIRGEYNINTANKNMLREMLYAAVYNEEWTEGCWNDSAWTAGFWKNGIYPDSYQEDFGVLIDNIIHYRTRNPFNDVSELKFVTGMTREIFDKVRPFANVFTNLLYATEKELYSLGDISGQQVARVISCRETIKFTEVEDIIEAALITPLVYEQINLFVGFSNASVIVARIPEKTVNVNGATVEELTGIGLLKADAEKLFYWRNAGFTFKSVGEVGKMLGFNPETLNAFEDNLITNDALNSFEGININFASQAQLRELGLTNAQVNSIQKMQGKMNNFHEIPVSEYPHDFDERITLYTNINQAGRAELESLFWNADPVLISDIVNTRFEQPFGSAEELEDFFVSSGFGDVYAKVKNFLVLR